MLAWLRHDNMYIYLLQADKQLELQLFRLFHNERDIDELGEDLARKNQALERENRKREKIDDEIKDHKKELGKLNRELAKMDQKIKESVHMSNLFVKVFFRPHVAVFFFLV